MHDFHQAVTEQIIAQLEAGTRPWQQPWNARPMRANGQPYRGINVLLLWMAAEARGYSAMQWMTYRQAAELGGQVRKGEKATAITYADKYIKGEGTDDERAIFFLKRYSVFNVEQIDGLPETIQAAREPEHRIAGAEAFFDSLPACITHGGNRAYYAFKTHHVQMPPFEAFRDAGSYYATLAHEIIHWTKHPACLDRSFGKARFGDDGYAREELVAELGAAFLCADLGLTVSPRPDHADYLASWLRVLKSDNRAIFSAASFAEKAVAFLQALHADTKQTLNIAA